MTPVSAKSNTDHQLSLRDYPQVWKGKSSCFSDGPDGILPRDRVAEGELLNNALAPDSAIQKLVGLFQLARYLEVEAEARHLLQAFPSSGPLWRLLGGSLRMQGRPAVAELTNAVRLMPHSAETHANLAVACKEMGLLDDAMASYRNALRCRPDFADAHLGLGNVLRDLGDVTGAITSYREAIALRSDFAEAHNNLGSALQAAGDLEGAADSFKHALQLRPGFALAHANLGFVQQNFGHVDQALASYRRAQALEPHALQHAVHARLMLPVIPQSVEAIAEARDRFQCGLDELNSVSGTLDDPGRSVDSCSFYLAYHGLDNRPLMEALCRMYQRRIPGLVATSAQIGKWMAPSDSGRRIRVGFLSEYLVGHTIGKHYRGFIEHLDRRQFEVTILHAPKARHDAFAAQLDAASDCAMRLPSRLADQQQAVADAALDVLFYPEIGMSPATYFLAHSRLAPVQVTSWGHPDTSGLESIDYFLSSALSETDEADHYYCERLIRLNRLPCCYSRATVLDRGRSTRDELGLPQNNTLYACPQSLFKVHPDFDGVLANIVETDPSALLVFPKGSFASWTELLKARWARTHPVLLDRVLFLPRMSWDSFMQVLGAMDVLLDPIHFGSGNTMYDAMLAGVPIVTWPGEFARGRNVAAAYRQMALHDAPVAMRLDDYAPLAVALGRDRDRRIALGQQIIATAQERLFDDLGAVRELEQFIVQAVSTASNGDRLAPSWRPS